MTAQHPIAALDVAADARGGPAPVPRLLRGRRIAIRVVYAVMSLWILMMASGVVDLVSGDIPEGPYAFAAGSTTVWKLLTAGGFLVLAWTAGRSIPAAQWVIVGQATWLAAELIAPQDPTEGPLMTVLRYVVNTVIFLGPWLLLSPDRREMLHLRAYPDRTALAVSFVLLPIAAVWALNNAALTIPDIGESAGLEITFDLVGLALSFAFVGVFGALRPRRVRWLLGTLAAAMAYAGVLTLLTPASDLASPGRIGGLAFLALAVVFAWRSRRPVRV